VAVAKCFSRHRVFVFYPRRIPFSGALFANEDRTPFPATFRFPTCLQDVVGSSAWVPSASRRVGLDEVVGGRVADGLGGLSRVATHFFALFPCDGGAHG